MATATSVQNAARKPAPTLEEVPTRKAAVRLVIRQVWTGEQYDVWEPLFEAAEAARKQAEQGALRVSISVPREKKGNTPASVGGQLVFRGGGIGKGSQMGCLSMRGEAYLLLVEPASVLVTLRTMQAAILDAKPEIKIKTTKSGPNEGAQKEQWTLGHLEVDDPSGFPARLETAIKRLVPVGANGNGNGR